MDKFPKPQQAQLSFQQYGRTEQLEIKTAADLADILQLDEALWVATDAPLSTINIDPRFLAALDRNDDRYVSAAEVKRAIRWLLGQFTDPAQIELGQDGLSLAALNTEGEHRRALHQAGSDVLARADRGDDISDGRVTLAAVGRIRQQTEAGSLGQAGMVLPTAAATDRQRAFLEAVLDTVGGAAHPSGRQAVTAARLEKFLQQAQALLDWRGQTAAPGRGNAVASAMLPLGEKTKAAYRLTTELAEKFDQFFALCALDRLEPVLPAQPAPLPLAQPDSVEPQALRDRLRAAPLARPSAEAVLDFEAALNPMYADQLYRFRDSVLAPLFELTAAPGRFSQQDWLRVQRLFAPYREWLAAKPDTGLDALDAERLRRYVTEPGYAEAARELLAESEQRAPDLERLRLLERLLLYQKHLLRFVNSYVSFPDLYDPDSRALFEMGTLIMDGRHFTLSVKVPDLEQHVAASAMSYIFMLYVECSDVQGDVLYTVAVPVTSGGRGNLRLNKRGIFHDLEGREHHARVIQIVENPISLTEAVKAPFQRIAQTINTKLQQYTSKAHEKIAAAGTESVARVQQALRNPDQQAPASGNAALAQGGLLAGGGIAIAAVGSSLAFITKTLASLSWQNIVGGLLVVVLIVLVPTALAAYLKLRRRDLSALLEGSGWAINARMRLTWQQADTFTFRPRAK